MRKDANLARSWQMLKTEVLVAKIRSIQLRKKQVLNCQQLAQTTTELGQSLNKHRTEKIATEAAREDADRLRTERGLIDAHLARIAEAMGVTAVGTVDRAAELSELLVRAA